MFKFRKAAKMFVERKPDGGMIVKPYHCVETLHNRKWRLVGDENGLRKFEKSEDRDAYLDELKKMAAESDNSNPTGLRCAGLDAHKQDPVVQPPNSDLK